MIHLLIVDEQELVRTGLRRILEGSTRVNKISEADCGEQAIKWCRSHPPDVALLNISLPGLSGFEITRRLQRASPDTAIVILAAHAKPPFPNRLLDAGATGYLTKNCKADELIAAVEHTGAGRRYIGTDAARQMAMSIMPGSAASPFEDLSAREMEVMLKITEGTRVPDIASLMCLSPKTIATYKYRIYDKLGTRSDVDLVRMAMRYGLVEAA